MRTALLACSLTALVGGARAADPTAEARARAALALAATKAPPVAAAPAPWPKVTAYDAAKQASIRTGTPIVIFVGCPVVAAKSREYIAAGVETMEGYAAGTVVVCYPAEETIWAVAKIACPAEPEVIEEAARDAAKKRERRAASSKKLDWS